jgi:hemerythrin-like domain-containing protein
MASSTHTAVPGRTPDLTIMHAIHTALRRDLTEACRAAGARAADPVRRQAVWTGWELFKTNLHHHHMVEETRVLPALRQRLGDRPGALSVLAEMDAEHEAIDPAIAAVEQAFATADADQVTAAMDALRDGLLQHLSHEEAEMLPLILEVVPVQLWDSFAKEQAKSMGLKGASQFFPWLLHEADARSVDTVLGHLPGPLRMVYRRSWAPAFAKMQRWGV